MVCTKWFESLPGDIVKRIFADEISASNLQANLSDLKNIEFFIDRSWDECVAKTKMYQPDVLQLLTHGVSGKGILWKDRYVKKSQLSAFLTNIAIARRAPLDTILLTVCHSSELVPEIRSSHWIVNEGEASVYLNEIYTMAFYNVISTHTIQEAHDSGLSAIDMADNQTGQMSRFQLFEKTHPESDVSHGL